MEFTRGQAYTVTMAARGTGERYTHEGIVFVRAIADRNPAVGRTYLFCLASEWSPRRSKGTYGIPGDTIVSVS